ncbi:hypothetical protein PS647_02822 [Pseudomonas fluorescens]|nr:hypothetical protein PS647_02822 [Pseudomonas fluorescens]
MEIFSFCLMLVGVGGGARGWRLVSSWEIGFVRVWVGYISVFLVTAVGGFALTASPFCQTTQKEPKSLAPNVRPLARARGSFAPAFIRGHRPPVGFAGTYMRWVRLRRTALRAHPRMNASTQPAEGAGGSRSRAAGELTLGLLSGEEPGCMPICLCSALLWERACSRRRRDSRHCIFSHTPTYRFHTPAWECCQGRSALRFGR